jgi:hypothetical protein
MYVQRFLVTRVAVFRVVAKIKTTLADLTVVLNGTKNNKPKLIAKTDVSEDLVVWVVMSSILSLKRIEAKSYRCGI